ncbi:MAG: hypothetical protein O3A96_17565 [Proteobacteria bacterium]|nr:hypothetical protein [Pseudomonadota bacterium]
MTEKTQASRFDEADRLEDEALDDLPARSVCICGACFTIGR